MPGPSPSCPAPSRHGRPLPSRPAPFRHGRPLPVMAGPSRHGRPPRHGRACPGHPRLCRPPRRSFASRYSGQHRQDESPSMRSGISSGNSFAPTPSLANLVSVVTTDCKQVPDWSQKKRAIMVDIPASDASRAVKTASVLLTTGGLTAAFAVTSCCGLFLLATARRCRVQSAATASCSARLEPYMPAIQAACESGVCRRM